MEMTIIESLGKAIEVIEKWVPMFEQHNTPAAIQEAIDELKAQESKTAPHEEARVLSLEAVKTYLADDDPDKNPLWVQWATSSVKGGWVLPHTVEDLMWRYESIYQAHWVLWTQKPNDKQKEAVLWRR